MNCLAEKGISLPPCAPVQQGSGAPEQRCSRGGTPFPQMISGQGGTVIPVSIAFHQVGLQRNANQSHQLEF